MGKSVQIEFDPEKLTQFTLRENKKCTVFIQILVKLYGEFADKLGSLFYFLQWRKKSSSSQIINNYLPECEIIYRPNIK